MSSMTYEEALNTLSSMFESWDRQTLIEIFQGNDHHMERTIECILSMEAGGNIDPPQPTASIGQPTGGGESLLDYGYDTDPGLPVMGKQSIEAQLAGNPGPLHQDSYRGTRCLLPDNFLRDEMFRREVMSAMGQNGLQKAASRRPQGQQQQQPQQYPQQHPAGAPPDVTDSIMRGLSTMGEGMKKQLSALATSFNAQRRKTRYGNSTADNSATNPLNSDPESTPLTAAYREDEDIGDSNEVINFDSSPNSRGGHTLNDFGSAPAGRPIVGGGAAKKDK